MRVKQLLIMGWAKVRIFFGYEYDKSVIPKGLYCYTPDYDKNVSMDSEDWDGSYYVKPCPHYVAIGNGWNGCKYRGIISDDMVFDDQCKICNENYGFGEVDDEDDDDSDVYDDWYPADIHN